MDLCPAQRELRTARLWLRAGDETLAGALLDFHQRNREHLAPWEPPVPAGFLSLAAQTERIRLGLRAFSEGSAFRYWISRADQPDQPDQPDQADQPNHLIGNIGISQVSRGAFHSAALGYALDAAQQGQGLMHEALTAVIAEMFSARVNLHRLQAAHRLDNSKSAAVLARLGFEPIGVARRYLFIEGQWRDHRLVERLNPGFQAPSYWLAGEQPGAAYVSVPESTPPRPAPASPSG